MGWILQQHGLDRAAPAGVGRETRRTPIGRKIGEALWPSRYPVEALEQIPRRCGLARFSQCLYQGNVAAAQGTIFQKGLVSGTISRLRSSFSRIVQSWDTSFKTGADERLLRGVRPSARLRMVFYLLSLWRDKVEFPHAETEKLPSWRTSGDLAKSTSKTERAAKVLIQELKTGDGLTRSLQ